LFEEELFQHLDLSKLDEISVQEINLEEIQDNFIVEHLPEILFNEKFENFRKNLIRKLYKHKHHKEARQFVERLNIARNLPKETKNSVTGVISALYNKTHNFLDWMFFKFIDLEHYTTQFAIKDLIFTYLSKIYNYNDNSDYSTHEHDILNPDEQVVPEVSSSSNSYNTVNYYTDVLNVQDVKMFEYLWQDIVENPNDFEEFQENINERIKFFQLLNSGVLVHEEQDYIWQTNPVDNNYLPGEISHILSFSKKFTNVDFSEQISLTLETNEDNIINTFKQQKLLKIKLPDNKLKLKQG
ncbi:MAG: hypothetical protein ACR2HS_07040, partial [Gammaproteobacteria bacterium]